MEPVIEYSNAPNRIPLKEKLRRSAVNHFEYAERVVEMRNLAQKRGDEDLVRTSRSGTPARAPCIWGT